MAGGWTIETDQIDDFEFFLPVCIITGILKFVVLGLSKMTYHDSEVYHRYENFGGVLLVLFQVIMFAYFLSSAIHIYMETQNLRFKELSVRIVIVGSLYFSAFPAILLSAYGVPIHWRSLYVELMRMLSEFICIVWMVRMMGAKDGLFREVTNFREAIPY